MNRLLRRYLPSFALLALGSMGCGSQQCGPVSRELMKPLQTAISAQKLEWVDATEMKIQAQVQAGKISQAEFQSFSAIIGKSRARDWKGAQRTLIALIDGQRASAEDVARLKAGRPNPAIAANRTGPGHQNPN